MTEKSVKDNTKVVDKSERDDYFRKKKEEYSRMLAKPIGLSDKVKQFIPDGFHGRIASGERSIEKYQMLGYTIATHPTTGEKISLPGFNLSYLMIIDKRDKEALDAAKAEKNAKYHNVNEADIVRNVIDPSSQNRVFSKT